MVFVDGIDSTTEPSTDWHGDWLKFVRLLGVEIPETLNKNDENFSEEDVLRWINDTVTAFCNYYRNRFEEYIRKLEETP
jgi:hypothetical protein